MDTERFNEEHAEKSRAVCERIEREDAERRSKLADLMDAQLKGELERAKAEADGWRRFAERRLGYIGECEEALAKRNERISKLEKQVSDLRAELANAKVLSERERQILDMWPRFEDGGLVWFGDAYIDGRGDANEVRDVRFDDKYVCLVGVEGFHTAFIIGERVKRPALKVLDADGVEIKVGDSMYVANNGDGPYIVCDIDENIDRIELFWHENRNEKLFIAANRLAHTRPDSWERLEEDALKGVCEYAEAERKPGTIDAHMCCGCRFDEDGDGPTCEKQMALDLIRRAKALAGAEVSE